MTRHAIFFCPALNSTTEILATFDEVRQIGYGKKLLKN